MNRNGQQAGAFMDISPGTYWSHTLGLDIDTCKRRVWYRVFGSWGGWARRPDPKTREIYLAKSTRNLDMHAGTLVHEAIKATLKRRKADLPLFPEDMYYARFDERFTADIQWSRSGGWRGLRGLRKAPCILAEHVAGLDVVQEQVDRCLEKAKLSFRSFLHHWLPLLEQDGSTTWAEIDELADVRWQGFNLFIVPDLLQELPGDKYKIIDWKTGDRQDFSQIATYAWYVLLSRPESITRNIHGVSIPLRADPSDVHGMDMSPEIVSDAMARVEAHLKWLNSVREAGVAGVLTNFPRTQTEDSCRFCLYKTICKRSEA
jgi:hypothetical protein